MVPRPGGVNSGGALSSRPAVPERVGAAEVVSVLALVLFVVLYGLTRYVTEPFPSFTLPSFGSYATPEASRSVTAPTIEVRFDDGSSASVEPQALMGVVGQNPVVVLSQQFRAGLTADGALAAPPAHLSGPSKLLKQLPAGQVWDGTSSRAQDPRTRAWLRARAQALFPGRTATEVVLTWVKTRYDRGSGAVLSTQALSHVVVSLT